MYSKYSPIVESLFPSFVLGETNFNNTLRNRNFAHLTGPFQPCSEWHLMFQRWEPIQYLLGGTLAMRDAGTKYLPMALNEQQDVYQSRLLKSVLFEAYSRTVSTLSALPFLTPVQAPKIPDELAYLLSHANGSEDSLAVLGRQLLSDMLNKGKAHLLVEYPATPDDVILSIRDEKEMNIRPYLVRVDPMNLIGWKYEYVGSKKELTQVRVAETTYVTDPKDEWSEIPENRVRVIEPYQTTVYRQVFNKTKGGYTSKKPSYEIVKQYPNSLEKIALVTAYGDKTGFMTSKPVLEGLAHLNISHFVKQSDLDSICHVASVPMLFAKGVGAQEVEGLEITSRGMFCLPNPDGDVKFIEHSGQAIGALQTEIKNIESRMVAMGADTLAARPTSTRETAASKIMDNTKSNSVLQAAVLNLEVMLSEAIMLAGEWMEVDLPEDFQVNIGDKMELSVDANELTSLIQLLENESLSAEDLALELKRRGTLSQSTTLKQPKKEQPTVTQAPQVDNTGEQVDNTTESI